MTCKALAALLNRELKIDAFHDVSHNGLQIENTGPITKVMVAVDGVVETLEAAAQAGAQMLIVHHGISWGDSLAQITGANYRIISTALRHNIALYGVHLPLDAHPVLGNNAQMAKALGLTGLRPFLDYHGQKIGFSGELPEMMTRESFETLVRQVVRPRRIDFFKCGVERVQTVGICSGGAPEGIAQAAQAGLDVYLCGEANLMAYNMAHDWQQNALFAGHYATERFGVFALATWLEQHTDLTVERLDQNLPY